jgi:hypothetical protein
MKHCRRLPPPVIVFGLLFLVVACSQMLSSPTSATPTVDSTHLTAFAQPQPTYPPIPTPTPTPIPPPLGRVPHDCQPGPTPQPILPGIGPVVGSPPVWAAGFDGPHAAIYLVPEAFNQYGWGRKIIWEVGPNYMHLVTLHGANLRSGARIRFQFLDGDPTISAVLDPHHPDHPGSAVGGDWNEWGSGMFLPTAGCYYLEASWPGGHLRITFAAGCCWSGVGEKVNPWGTT